ncbi:MAG: hypothetical protein H8E76_08090 [Helicobacteraceae bacterium]|nr:hypothetical protein [Candidatus Sulfurimonas ponti]MBL6972765.1 hypothetical protein [Sulfurimonas sp.]
MAYALGGRYKINTNLELGLSAIYIAYEDRTSTQSGPIGVRGTLSGKAGYGVTTGIFYKF